MKNTEIVNNKYIFRIKKTKKIIYLNIEKVKKQKINKTNFFKFKIFE